MPPVAPFESVKSDLDKYNSQRVGLVILWLDGKLRYPKVENSSLSEDIFSYQCLFTPLQFDSHLNSIII